MKFKGKIFVCLFPFRVAKIESNKVCLLPYHKCTKVPSTPIDILLPLYCTALSGAISSGE
jgi:hypothetical protein